VSCAIAADTELLTLYGWQAAVGATELEPAQRARLDHLRYAAPTTLSIEKLEEAIVQVLVGERSPKAIAQEYGIDRMELERLAGLYRMAGREAVARDRKP
jgi:hypothetical protein